MAFRTLLLGAALAALAPAIHAGDAQTAGQNLTGATANLAPLDPAGQWTRQARDYANTRYSPLTQINKDNVKNLQLVWSWGLTPGGTTQETPLVHDGVMFVQNSTHLIQALDAATGELLWQYQHRLPDTVSPNGVRTKAIYGDNLIVATRDAHVIAINAKTGKLELIAGTGEKGDGPDGDPLQCKMARLHGIFVDKDGSVFIGDSETHRVRVLRKK